MVILNSYVSSPEGIQNVFIGHHQNVPPFIQRNEKRYPLVNVYVSKITVLLMGKFTISTGPCSIAMLEITMSGI